MIYDFATWCVSNPCSQQDTMNSPINLTWQVTATQGQLSAFPDAMNPFVVMLSTHDS